MKIQMVDLRGQYDRIQQEIDDAVLQAIKSTNFINGPEVKTFQQSLEAYLDAECVIPCANGTDALQIALMALGLQRGDEVIVPAFTYVATAEVIALLGFTPVWVDVDPDTFNIDVNAFEKAITSKTKAVVPVHLYGQCADMDRILSIAKEHGIFVVEDTAQAIGATYTFLSGERRKAGTMGHIGCTSFFPSKNLGCYGDGGAMYTNDTALGKQIRMIANHGQEKKYYHDVVGVNSRLDTVQAAILNVKLKYLDNYSENRNLAAKNYDELLKNVGQLRTPIRSEHSTHVFHQYTLVVNDGSRDALKQYLEAQGIPTMIYYPVPMHMQKAYRSSNYPEGSFPVAERLCKQVLSLPIHTEMTIEEQRHITDAIQTFYHSK